MRDFSTTPSCQARTLCRECRDPSPAGDAWRAEFAKLSMSVPAVCPHGVDGLVTPIAATHRPTAPDPRLGQFHAMWRELHTTVDADAKWLEAFTLRLPCGDCREHWKWVLWSERPLFGHEWFAWTVRAHNAVNFKLGKAELSIQDARAIWLDPAGIDRPSKAG